jgi:tetratricopeptide (TPR) repeat protein
MISKENGFTLNIKWKFSGGREYAAAFIALFVFLIIIYSNSFQGQWIFDDKHNIVENRNIFLKNFDWPDVKKTFHDPYNNISRPLAYFSFALNYYFDGLNVFGYHIINLIIHYLSSVFVFLFIFNTLKLQMLRNQYRHVSYSIALLAVVFWATSPVQVTAVTYIVQRMASMAGLFYIMAMYFYLKGRTSINQKSKIRFFTVALLCALFSFATKENAVLLPISIWFYDLLLIQGATRENIIKNLKLIIPVIVVVLAVSLWYVNILSFFSGEAYKIRPFTLGERLLTEPRVMIFYISLLLYPDNSRLMLLHDIRTSTSLLNPWTTMPAIALIAGFVVLAVYISRKKPLITFCILFFFINHFIEGSFIPLELIYEHRNYIPSMLFFVPIAILVLHVIDFFSDKKTIQIMMIVLFTFLLFAQGHTVFARNALFSNPLLLWSDNVVKTPMLSRPHDVLGSYYWNLGFHDKAYILFSRALSLNRDTNLLNRSKNLHNIGLYHLYVTGEYDKALDFFYNAQKIYPGFDLTYHSVALCFIHKGDLNEAERRLKQAILIWPNNADMRHAQSFIFLKTDNNDEAIKEARQAFMLNPDLSGSLSILGEAYRKKGNYITAIYYWERYIGKNPNNIRGNLALIELYDKQNKKHQLYQIIGKLMTLKGQESWHEFINQTRGNPKLMGYTPDPETVIQIFRRNLCDHTPQAIKLKSASIGK